MATFKRDLEAAAGETIHCKGNRFNVINGTPLVVEINGKRNLLTEGQGLIFPVPFESVYIESVADQVGAQFFIGDEIFTDARLVGDVVVSSLPISAGFSADTQVTKSDTETLVCAAASGQKELHIRSGSASTGKIWVGGALNTGIALSVNELLILNVSCDITLYSEGSNDIQIQRVLV